eukprot:gene31860-64014_t
MSIRRGASPPHTVHVARPRRRRSTSRLGSPPHVTAGAPAAHDEGWQLCRSGLTARSEERHDVALAAVRDARCALPPLQVAAEKQQRWFDAQGGRTFQMGMHSGKSFSDLFHSSEGKGLAYMVLN